MIICSYISTCMGRKHFLLMKWDFLSHEVFNNFSSSLPPFPLPPPKIFCWWEIRYRCPSKHKQIVNLGCPASWINWELCSGGHHSTCGWSQTTSFGCQHENRSHLCGRNWCSASAEIRACRLTSTFTLHMQLLDSFVRLPLQSAQKWQVWHGLNLDTSILHSFLIFCAYLRDLSLDNFWVAVFSSCLY